MSVTRAPDSPESSTLVDDRSWRARLRPLAMVARVNLGILALAPVALIVLLNSYWRENSDLAHGFLMPAIFLWLLNESRKKDTPRYLPSDGRSRIFFWSLGTLAIVGLCATGLFAAALAWSHSLVAFTGTLSLVLFLAAGLVAFSTTSSRLLPFNWTSVSAVGLWLLCAPIPPSR